MKTKILLPVLAIVFAVGLSFAFVNMTGDDFYDTAYIQLDGKWEPVQVNCPGNGTTCLVQIEGETTTHPVYAVENPGPNDLPLESNSPFPEIIEDPR